MKGRYFTFLLITLLGASTPAFAQTLVIFKNARSIEVDSVRYENNQCIYTKNGFEKRVPLGLIEEIYVLNKGTIYPPQHRYPKHPEPTETLDSKIISDTRETNERHERKKKSKDITASKDTVEPAEQTYLYKPPQGFFQCEIPKSWNYTEMSGVHMFSPYSLAGRDIDKTYVQIMSSREKVPITTFSKEYKVQIIEGLERMGEKVVADRVRIIDGIEAWEKFLEVQRYSRKRREIMLVHDGYMVMITLDASAELYASADRQFERIVESLKFF